jgi:hypothetical protein
VEVLPKIDEFEIAKRHAFIRTAASLCTNRILKANPFR